MIDARDPAAFGGVHIPGSIHIGLAKRTAKGKDACDLW
jgi:rhodanese-related sulfurtransferase